MVCLGGSWMQLFPDDEWMGLFRCSMMNRRIGLFLDDGCNGMSVPGKEYQVFQ